MRYSFLCVLLAVGHLPFPTSAQVNIEALRGPDKEGGITGTVELDLSVRSGNVETVELGYGGRLDYESTGSTTFVLGSGDLGWEGGERFSNQALAHLRHVRRRGATLRPEVFVQYDYDRSRSLLHRGLFGAGLRLDLHRGERRSISFGSSYMFEHERLEVATADPHESKTSVHRWSSYLSSKIESERTSLTWTVYLQPQFDKLEDLRVLSEAELGVEANSLLSLVISLRTRYDSRTPMDAKSTDTELSTGIAILF